ncbi:MAG: M67 family metallopeptidase [Thermodesulfovibrionales bacterium]|nr:M67 family metallopeptidase [Thermodesulfovibrionales bacterium]
MQALSIPKAIIDEMVAHAKGAYPKEACGILSGSGDAVEKLHRMRNADLSSTTYMMHPDEQLNVMRDIEKDGKKMLAIYHSHPASPAYPSQIDINRAFFPGTDYENFPGTAYVIIGLAEGGPEIKAFLLIGKAGIREITIVPV